MASIYQQEQSLVLNDVSQLGVPRFGWTGDLDKGGQNGIGVRTLCNDGATPQPFPPAWVVIIHEPTMWDTYFTTLQKQHKSIWEQHAKSIDGIDFGLTVDPHDLPYGHDGQQYSMPVMSKRTAVNPVVNMDEVVGNLGWGVHYMYIKHLCHPDTCASILSAVRGSGMPPWVWSTFTFSALVIQPDTSGLYDRILDAYCLTNMWPTETGLLGVKRELATATVPQRSFTHKAIVTHNENTRELGRLVFATMNIHKVNYDLANTYTGMDGALTTFGLSKVVKEALADFKLNTGGAGTINSGGNDTASEAFENYMNGVKEFTNA